MSEQIITTEAAKVLVPDIRTVDLGLYEGCTFLRLKRHKVGLRVKVKDHAAYLLYLAQLQQEQDEIELSGGKIDRSKIAADVPRGKVNGKKADTSKVAGRETKQVIVSETLQALNDAIQRIADRVTGRFGIAQQSRIIEGLYFVRNEVGERDLRDQVEEIIEAGRAEIRDKFLPAFEASYEADIEATRTLPLLEGGLGPIFDPADYPKSARAFAANILGGTPTSYGLTRLWVDLNVASTLSDKLRQKCNEEYKLQVQSAAEEAKQALRASLGKFLDNLVERLTPDADGKKKTFRDTLTENIKQFCDVFESRNFANDTDLAAIVQRCRETLEGVEPEKLRKYESVRDNTLQRFSELQKATADLIVKVPGRAFEDDED